jgi:hypothetical protein
MKDAKKTSGGWRAGGWATKPGVMAKDKIMKTLSKAKAGVMESMVKSPDEQAISGLKRAGMAGKGDNLVQVA